MPLPLLFAPAAADDLEDIALFIALDSPAGALSFVAELRARCAVIAHILHGSRLVERIDA